jgi:hypothetical protein
MLRTLLVLSLLALVACGGCLAKRQVTRSPEKLPASHQEVEPVPKWVGPATWWDAHPLLTFTGLVAGLVAGITALCALVVACWVAAGGPVL